jgi:hypothetical protein
MTLAELLLAARARLHDDAVDVNGAVVDVLWSNSQLTSWANEANSEACRRTRYLVDSTLKAAIVAGKADYAYPDGVIFPRRAQLDGEDRPLRFISYKDLDEWSSGWQAHTGTPTHIICDMSIDKYLLYPTPDAAGLLRFTAIIEPEAFTSESELPARFGYGLIDWLCYRAYQVPDTDQFNKQLSLESLAAFEAEFGTRSSAKDEIFNFRNLPFGNFDGSY